MESLLNKLAISVKHLKCLDEVFRDKSSLYKQIEAQMIRDLGDNLEIISQELYAGGKSRGGLSRQMILGDIIEYIFSGRAYYYAAKSEENFRLFSKVVLYCVNQLLLFDTVSINPEIRKSYIQKLEQEITPTILYEKEGDRVLANELKSSDVVYKQDSWGKYNAFVDSILPKTLGCPKELVVFIELIRLDKGLIIPLLLIQRLFGGGVIIAPPDFLLLKRNREIFGIELGYGKEEQCREFSLRTSVPTVAVDLSEHMHNRCPKCGENILYCDVIIHKYANKTLWETLDSNGKFICKEQCPLFKEDDIARKQCLFSNYYGKYKGRCFYGDQTIGDDKKDMHYHAKCISDGVYDYRSSERNIWDYHNQEYFAQIPKIEGIESI